MNNWLFGRDQILEIIKSLEKAKIDIIECGYLELNGIRNEHSTRFSSINSFEDIMSDVSPEIVNSQLFLMIDYKPELPFEEIPHKNNTKGCLDGIRLAFSKKHYKQAIKCASDLMEKGYKVCIQPMVTSSYKDQELLDLINLTNQLNPFAFYIVDTLGTMNNEDVERLYHLVDQNLNKSIKLGLHTHNNNQLAYSNSVEFLNIGNDRGLMLDSSLYGMGREGGNLNTEIIADYLNKSTGTSFNLIPLLQIIDNIFK
ncbi:hypothetical protein ACFOU2_08730 [Bacillus songklensis]|uniref:Pyruvate carboxyltransferase domain-containing protein n=1 Tax=Bacillus songklensis TaxID=1069116 RepID=A0ABV8B366_9BACI